MKIEKIFENNQSWIKGKLSLDQDYFVNLSKGQSPAVLYIGCSDSRVTAESLMGLNPGDVFVHRNIANMVPNTDVSALGVINYAITHLKVDHVVVCGHYYCGGVKAAMQPADLGILNPWLANIRDVYRLHQAELDGIKDEDARYRRLVELNVQEQCFNVMKTIDFQNAAMDREITAHGWVFDIHSGKLIDLEIDFNQATTGFKNLFQLSS